MKWNADNKTFYSSTSWRKLRTNKLNNNPICEVCNIKPATEVHHTIPLSSTHGKDNALNYNTLQSICFDCHVAETIFERTGKRAKVKLTQRQLNNFDPPSQASTDHNTADQ